MSSVTWLAVVIFYFPALSQHRCVGFGNVHQLHLGSAVCSVRCSLHWWCNGDWRLVPPQEFFLTIILIITGGEKNLPCNKANEKTKQEKTWCEKEKKIFILCQRRARDTVINRLNHLLSFWNNSKLWARGSLFYPLVQTPSQLMSLRVTWFIDFLLCLHTPWSFFLSPWLCWIFVAVLGLSQVAASDSLAAVVHASHCGGFSCCKAWFLGAQASVVALLNVRSSQNRDRTCVPYIGRQIRNHWTRGSPTLILVFSANIPWAPKWHVICLLCVHILGS